MVLYSSFTSSTFPCGQVRSTGSAPSLQEPPNRLYYFPCTLLHPYCPLKKLKCVVNLNCSKNMKWFFFRSRRWPAEQIVLTDVMHILNVTEIQSNICRGTVCTQVWSPAQFCPWYIIHGDSHIPNHHFKIFFSSVPSFFRLLAHVQATDNLGT